MHIVQVLAELSLGGSQLVAVELCEHLRAQGHKVTIIAKQGALSQRVIDTGAEILDWSVGKKRLKTLRLIKPLRAWFAQHQVDVVHVHSRLPAWIAWLALRKLPKRPAFVTSMHGHYSVNRYSAIMARGDKVIAVSEHMRGYTLKHYPPVKTADVVTIHGGIEHQDFPNNYQPTNDWLQKVNQDFPYTQAKKWLMLPARLTQWKGHEAFLEMLAVILQQRSDVHGLLVGPAREGSSYQRKLLALIQQLDIAEHVTLTGAQQDMRPWYAKADVVYNLSNNPPEAFGRTVLEALSIGTPVLDWDQAGPAEQLDRIYPFGKVALNQQAPLVEKTLQLLDKPEHVQAFSDFSMQESMQATLNVYQMVAR